MTKAAQAAIEHDRRRRAAAAKAVPTAVVAGTDALQRVGKYEVTILRPFTVKEYVLANTSSAAQAYAREKYGKHGWAEFVCLHPFKGGQ